MTIRTIIAVGVGVGLCAAAHAQNRGGAAFSASGTRCSDVTWSQESLQRYPRIASACREVMQRDGKYYVKFEGEVERVADGGRQLTIDFRDGDTLTVTPPENLSLTIDGRARAARDLRPGDALTFYIPQDQLAASFFEGEPQSAPPQVAQITPVEPTPQGGLLAQNQPPRQGTLPRTASPWPLAGLLGALSIACAALLSLWRRARA
jgi:hypothetical protein